MEWRIVIVDDLQSDAYALSRALRERLHGEDALELTYYESAEAMLAEFAPGAYRLAFLDVRMDGMSGVELAQKLRAADRELMIVFLTTSPEYIFDVVGFHPFDYLLKPCQPDKLDHVLSEARRMLAAVEPELAVRVNRAEVRVPYRELVAVAARDHEIEVRTVSGQTLTTTARLTDELRALADDPRFLACYRGVLLNMDHIVSFGKSTITMLGGAEYPMRVRERKELMERYSQHQTSGTRRRMG